eukprot:1120244-Rhodomonas_salina.1
MRTKGCEPAVRTLEKGANRSPPKGSSRSRDPRGRGDPWCTQADAVQPVGHSVCGACFTVVKHHGPHLLTFRPLAKMSAPQRHRKNGKGTALPRANTPTNRDQGRRPPRLEQEPKRIRALVPQRIDKSHAAKHGCLRSLQVGLQPCCFRRRCAPFLGLLSHAQNMLCR